MKAEIFRLKRSSKSSAFLCEQLNCYYHETGKNRSTERFKTWSLYCPVVPDNQLNFYPVVKSVIYIASSKITGVRKNPKQEEAFCVNVEKNLKN